MNPVYSNCGKTLLKVKDTYLSELFAKLHFLEFNRDINDLLSVGGIILKSNIVLDLFVLFFFTSMRLLSMKLACLIRVLFIKDLLD